MTKATVIRSIAISFLVTWHVTNFSLPAAFSQETKSGAVHNQHQNANPQNLLHQIREMQTKIAELEAALKQNHSADANLSARHNANSKTKGMKKMNGMRMGSMKGSGTKSTQDKMPGKSMPSMGGGKAGMGMMNMDSKSSGGMMGMKGMGMSRGMMMMGKMKSMGSMNTQSSLPGFPGASHIYHIGADGFFLNHGQHISLTDTQQKLLNKIKEETLLNQAELDRKIESAEQDSWVLTSSDQPDGKKIKAKIDEIATLQAQQRMSFIQAVGKAAGVLTDQQRAKLTGTPNDNLKKQ